MLSFRHVEGLSQQVKSSAINNKRAVLPEILTCIAIKFNPRYTCNYITKFNTIYYKNDKITAFCLVEKSTIILLIVLQFN